MSANALETQVNDPLMYLAPLPHVGRYYPFGFPVDIASDMREVLDAAHESWGMYAPRFDKPPIRLHVLTSEGSGGLPPSPVLRGQRNLLMWVSDQENFAVCDRRQAFGYCCVTRATVADRVFFRWHFLEALVYTLLELNYFTSVHAACVAREGAGVLLFGESGVGKSTLSYACARRGWTYVSDDSSSVLRDGRPDHHRRAASFPVSRRGAAIISGAARPHLGPPVGPQAHHRSAHRRLCRFAPRPIAGWTRIVFLDRQPGSRAGLTRIAKQEAQERIRQGMAVFDPELEPRRIRTVETICEAPAFALRYPGFEDAVLLLEQLVRGQHEGGLLKLLLAMLLLAAEALAQTASAALFGTVVDESSAVAPAVTVTAREQSTGFTRSTVTNQEGGYTLEALPPGWYTVTAVKPGFRATAAERVQLTVSQKAVLDLKLFVGEERQSITATAAVSPVQSNEASIGYLFDSQTVEALPLDTRNIVALVTLGPGAIPRQLGGFTHDVVNDVQQGSRGSVAFNPPMNGSRSTMNSVRARWRV